MPNIRSKVNAIFVMAKRQKDGFWRAPHYSIIRYERPPNAAMNFTNDIIRVEAIDSLWFIEMHGCWVLSRSLSLSKYFPGILPCRLRLLLFLLRFSSLKNWNNRVNISTENRKWDGIVWWCGVVILTAICKWLMQFYWRKFAMDSGYH